MTRLESRFWWLGLDSSHVEKNGDSTRVTFFIEWLDSTGVTVNDSRLESESFLQNLWVPNRQTHFVCTQRNEPFLLQWWPRLAQIFSFACLVVLCYIQGSRAPTCTEQRWLRIPSAGVDSVWSLGCFRSRSQIFEQIPDPEQELEWNSQFLQESDYSCYQS